MTKVRAIKPRPTTSRDEIAVLRQLIAALQKGEAVSFAVAAVYRDGDTLGAYGGDVSLTTVGTLAWTQARLLEDLGSE